jgi:hypothetical protein
MYGPGRTIRHATGASNITVLAAALSENAMAEIFSVIDAGQR